MNRANKGERTENMSEENSSEECFDIFLHQIQNLRNFLKPPASFLFQREGAKDIYLASSLDNQSNPSYNPWP